MHIKQLVIQGFKSYKEQTVTEPFSPKHNVIVGRNGSGKSNFFAAIRFVLSDAYTHMSREERQALLHEGSGTAVMSAYVEVVFDNSDNRFPTGRDEVVLRRTIGLKKDEYSLDRKSASKSDVMNLLESAGFSRSNPYYIVPQGRITALTNAKDAERLALLKEVAGTQVYEQRRAESLKVMTESSGKREKIDELLQFLEERLNVLDEEKDELRKYQELDRERRCLEYTLHDRELKEINMHLDQLEDDRVRNSASSSDRVALFAERDQVIQNLEAEGVSLKQRIALIQIDYKQVEDERKELLREKAQRELQLRDVRENDEVIQRTRQRRIDELKRVKDLIQQKEMRLKELTPKFEDAQKAEHVVKKALAEATASQQRLYSKQGRNAKFNSKADRDKWLQQEIEDIRKTIDQRVETRNTVQASLKAWEDGLQTTKSNVEGWRQQLAETYETVDGLEKRQQDGTTLRDEAMNRRKELWREESQTKALLDTARSELDRAERNFSSTMDRAQSAGLRAVRQITQNMGLGGVYGPLCDLIEVDDKYKTAVEVTAGNSLFHIVVDNDATASTIMEILNKERSGRVTFMPLNRLHPKSVNYPETDEVIPLIAKLKYTREHERAVKQVFSKTIVCWNLESSSQYARTHGLNAITLQGDQASKKGVLTGGYHDSRRSRIDAVKGMHKWRDEYEKLRTRSVEITREIEKKDQEVTEIVGDLKKTDAERQKLTHYVWSLNEKLREATQAENSTLDGIATKRVLLDETVADIETLNKQFETLRTELLSAFDRNLTADEVAQLSSLTSEIQKLRVQDTQLSNTRVTLEQEKVLLDVELRDSLYQQLDQLQAEMLEHRIENENHSASVTQLLEQVEQRLAAREARLQEVEGERDDLEAELAAHEAECSKLQAQQLEDARAIEREQKQLERAMSKRGILLQRKDELGRKIRDLGALPEEAFDSYEQIQSDAVLKRLHKLTEELKEYSHINKKAFEQYTNFTRQREALLTRREELEKSQASIEELIQVLDQRKDEAIERTFKQVSKSFSEIFEKLVPAGCGRLIIQKRMDRNRAAQYTAGDESESDDEEAAALRNSVENYVGVAISVSFNSKSDEQQRIEQLSGGQKSLCALALIFAIQQCDPAPFYLFDEIDANLDAQYRTSVASMIKELADNGQFICTTFRNEMIYTADKFYGVLFNNKISSIASISREDALSFVEGQQPR
ncbi:RecF/RecN/SMC [Limtongia smithiae]|uniref:RecF/RecN/SMC n=1 Tax=Limtongia smithiae TaxID=1125753 RepID=UPI0034CFD324